jgi:hypothetical protein
MGTLVTVFCFCDQKLSLITIKNMNYNMSDWTHSWRSYRKIPMVFQISVSIIVAIYWSLYFHGERQILAWRYKISYGKKEYYTVSIIIQNLSSYLFPDDLYEVTSYQWRCTFSICSCVHTVRGRVFCNKLMMQAMMILLECKQFIFSAYFWCSYAGTYARYGIPWSQRR